MKLVTSNPDKLNEFKRQIPDMNIEKGIDLEEVMGDQDQVIIYKAIDAGKDRVVEDTILEIDGKEVVDIRYTQAEALANAKKAKWVVSLGYNDGNTIKVYRGIIKGSIVKSETDGFGFDPYFVPENSSKTLAVLDKEDRKDEFSARFKAIKNLKNDDYLFQKQIKDVPKWNGKYQK